ncbi:hypothetical protein [Arthrobacter mobilis]|uniref:CBU-0592-like domain-containing protein n=1 Tax=Arthrobacter mobilis TaxID=2724944 RepID=A0A7X6HEF3_9MICC|nr:hypothetical protein [Arthrobacter mobilis]NKX55624.1 hypothetical protein [Arthrobacter mobilis]
MLSRGWLTSESRRYAALNTVGGLMGGVGSALYGAWPSAAANFAWAALGLHALIEGHRRRRPGLGVNEIPGPAPAADAHLPGTGAQDPAVLTGPLERAVCVQAPAGPQRRPGRVVAQLP